MSSKIITSSFTANETVIAKARVRAKDSERGNFSAYIEKLILLDLRKNPVVLKKEAK